MQRTVLKYAPDYWDCDGNLSRQITLNTYANEYEQIAFEVKNALQNQSARIVSIKRNQNIHDYGQFILREQLLAVTNSSCPYYRVRRYVTLRKHYLNIALEYNIDPRRCGKSSLIFQKYITCGYDDLILVVWVITNQPEAISIQSQNSSEYFIDYIVEID